MGILIRRDHHTSAAIAKVKQLVRKSDALTQKVGDATVRQIGYFTHSAQPAPSRSQVLTHNSNSQPAPCIDKP